MGISMQVAEADQFSFRQLMDVHEEGYSVMRSPHFTSSGLSATNLGIAALGFETVGYDWSFIAPGGRQLERNDPLLLGRVRLASEPRLTTIEASIRADRLLPETDVSVVDYHVDKLNAAFGRTDIRTMSDYVAKHRSLFREVIDVALSDETIRAKFVHGVDSRGRKAPGYFLLDSHEVTADAVYGSGGEVEVQAHVPMPVVLASLFAMQASDSGKETVYHFAGSDMLKYLDSYQADVCSVLAGLACRGLVDTNLEVVVVPSSDTLVIAREKNHEKLEAVFACVQRMNSSDKLDASAAKREYNTRFNELRRQNLSVSVLNARAHGGNGILVLDNALDIPIGHLQRRSAKLMH